MVASKQRAECKLQNILYNGKDTNCHFRSDNNNSSSNNNKKNNNSDSNNSMDQKKPRHTPASRREATRRERMRVQGIRLAYRSLQSSLNIPITGRPRYLHILQTAINRIHELEELVDNPVSSSTFMETSLTDTSQTKREESTERFNDDHQQPYSSSQQTTYSFTIKHEEEKQSEECSEEEYLVNEEETTYYQEHCSFGQGSNTGHVFGHNVFDEQWSGHHLYHVEEMKGNGNGKIYRNL